MRVSSLYGVALKEAPSEAESAGHRLLLRSGLFRQLGSGLFTALPLGWRALRKIEQILREEMDAIGGQEISMPVVHPAEVWQASGRFEQVGAEMVRFQDRRGADLVLAMTHEEVVAWHARSEVSSYRQMPMLVYQIQTKFRDEPRARGGLIRVREFVMKDSYSLDRDEAGLKLQYEAHRVAYRRIFERCGLPVVEVQSDTGMMGGTAAHEYMYVSDIGEDHLIICDQCGYAANREVARFRRPDVAIPAQPMSKVETPGTKTIADLSEFLGVSPAQTAKAVMYVASWPEAERADQVVLALVRGDTEANEISVGRAVGAGALRPAEEAELRAAGLVPGYAGPVGLSEGAAIVVLDAMLAVGGFVSGANEEGFHLQGVAAGRDFTPDIEAEIALAHEGAPCIDCGGLLALRRGVEVGNIFQLGTRYTEAVQARFLDENGKTRPIVMGSYGIGVGRLLACLAEEHRDDNGLILPAAVAPMSVCLVALARKAEARAAAEELYVALRAAGVSVLFDDRPKISAGVKFAEADLRGLPLRAVISDRGVKSGTCELAWRRDGVRWSVPIEEAVEQIQAALAEQGG
ncbi:MAG: prolyl-tRNA synthetase [Myxococcota bacterium]|jgi:prolyl-tRNA synthetase